MGFPHGIKSVCECRRCKRHGFNPWVEKIPPGVGNGNPLQYSCLENLMYRLQSMGSQRVGHDWATEHTHTPLVKTGVSSARNNQVSVLCLLLLGLLSSYWWPGISHCHLGLNLLSVFDTEIVFAWWRLSNNLSRVVFVVRPFDAVILPYALWIFFVGRGGTIFSLWDLNSPTRDWTQAHISKRWSLNHRTTRTFPVVYTLRPWYMKFFSTSTLQRYFQYLSHKLYGCTIYI